MCGLMFNAILITNFQLNFKVKDLENRVAWRSYISTSVHKVTVT